MTNRMKLKAFRNLLKSGIYGFTAWGIFLFPCMSSAQTARIVVDALKVENSVSPYMYGSCIEDVNHEIYGGLYDQKIFGESFEEAYSEMTFEGFTGFGGHWEGEGKLVAVKADAGAKLINDTRTVADGSVEVELKFDSPYDIAGLIVRVSNPAVGADNFDGYEISLNANSKRMVLGKHAQNWQPIREAAADFVPEEWNLLRVVLSGANLRLYLNDNPNPVIDYTDNSSPFLSGKIGLRTWNSDVTFRNLKIETGGNAEEIYFQSTVVSSGMWDLLSENALALFSQDTDNPSNGKLAQKIDYPDGTGKAGVINRGLNRWGIAVKSGQVFQGRVYLRADNFNGKVYAALESADGTVTYASHEITGITGSWEKYPFSLTANASDPNARFVLWMESAGTLWLDQAVLQGTGEEQFHGLPYRADIGNAMVAEGLTFLRYGGTMVNAPEYRFKKMIGDPDSRPPYRGHWYPYSSNGFGIEDFLKFCEAAGFEPAFAINIEETAQDAADMVEYLNGDISTTWGAKRAENGHPEPYNVKYIEIGNEETLEIGKTVYEGDSPFAYGHYVERFLELYNAMIAKDPELQFISAAWWRPGSPNIKSVFTALNGKAAYWDFHPWADDANAGTQTEKELIQMENLFKQWDPNTTMKCVIFEENGNLHNQQRALGHATTLNAVRRHADFVLTSCAANALQPYKQNDNGWDQGQIFFTPSQVWAMPPFYAQQMASSNHLPLRVEEKVTGNLNVTATRSEDGKTLVLHVVNTSNATRNTSIELKNFIFGGEVKLWTLSGNLSDENTPEEPERIITKETTINVESNAFNHSFLPYSYTILRFTDGTTTGMKAVAGRSETTNVVCLDDYLTLTYPSELTSVSVYNLSGSRVAAQTLNPSGKDTMLAANMSRGVYFLKFRGEKTVVVKCLK